MSWILVAIIGYLLLAVEAVITKLLLVSRVKSWQVYSFYIGIFSFFSLIFLPLTDWTGWENFQVSFFSGLLFFFSLVFLYRGLEKTSASRVYVLFGAVTTIFSFIFAHLFLGNSFTFLETSGLVFLVFGSGLVSFKFYKGKLFNRFWEVAVAGAIMGASLVVLKAGYNSQDFWSGYVFSRAGIGFGALIFMLLPFYRLQVLKELGAKNHKEKAKNFFGVSFAKSLSGIGTILINFAISSGSVAVVAALSATQYLFTLILALFLGYYFHSIRERVDRQTVVYKFLGVLLVIAGVVVISL